MEQEKVFVVTKLYKETIKFEYNIFHSTYMSAKTEGIIANNEVRGNKQVGAISLIFLTYNTLRNGCAPIKTNNTFKELYFVPHPPPEDLLQEMLYLVNPALELKMEFYISILQGLVMNGETVYNIFGGSKLCIPPW